MGTIHQPARDKVLTVAKNQKSLNVHYLYYIPRGQSFAAYTLNGGWFIAGGYDGTKLYPEPTDYSSTLKLVNEVSFEEGVQVSLHFYTDHDK